MTTAVQRRRGTSTEHASFTGLDGEITVNTTTYTVHVHDGVTVGGIVLAKADGSNIATSSIDINGGTIDGTVIGGSSAAAGSFTTISASGEIAANGGIALGDNDAATFGDSDDLQIYHSGSNSFIKDAGTGALILDTDGTQIILSANSVSEYMAIFNINGAANLYHNNSLKFQTTSTGIDVTGTVVSDGLTVDGNVGIGTNDFTDSYKTIIEGSDQETGNLTDSGTHGATLFLRATGEGVGSGGAVAFGTTFGNKRPFAAIKGYITDGSDNSTGHLVFSTRATTSATALSERLRITDTGRVGIATSSPAYTLNVDGDIIADGDGNTRAIGFDFYGALKYNLYMDGTTDADKMHIRKGATNVATFDSSGNFGIGTTSPTQKLSVAGAGFVATEISGDSTSETQLRFSSNTAARVTQQANQALIFDTNATERARLDASGNLLVGTTSTPNGGHVLKISSGTVSTIETDATALTNMVVFRNGNGNVGTIQTSASSTSYNTSSDERLKENITDAPAGNIDAIKVRSFDWKADGSHQEYGMVAQELEAVAPYAVTKGETEDDMWSVDYSKLVPMLIKEIQDLKAEVAALKGA